MAHFDIVEEPEQNKNGSPQYALCKDSVPIFEHRTYPFILKRVGIWLAPGDTVTELHANHTPMTQTYEQFKESERQVAAFLAGG